VLYYNVINYSILSYSLHDENYATSIEKQSTCGEKYRNIFKNIAIFLKYRDNSLILKYDIFWRFNSIQYIDIEFDIIDISSHH